MLADIPVEDVLRWGWMATAASNAVWDNDGAYTIAARHVQLVRDAGALGQLPLFLSALGIARAWVGDFAGAASNMAEADSVAASTGSVSMPWTALRLRALQEGSRGRRSDSERDRASRSRSTLAAAAHWAAAVLYNGGSRYDKAAASARQATSNASSTGCRCGCFRSWSRPVRVEDTTGAREALERLAETTSHPPTRLASRRAAGRC